jgi:Transcription activator MBF2
VFEIQINSDHHITCVKVLDQIPEGDGATPSLSPGGFGEKFVFIDVQGQYGHGIHFKIIVRGFEDKKKENKSGGV